MHPIPISLLLLWMIQNAHDSLVARFELLNKRIKQLPRYARPLQLLPPLLLPSAYLHVACIDVPTWRCCILSPSLGSSMLCSYLTSHIIDTSLHNLSCALTWAQTSAGFGCDCCNVPCHNVIHPISDSPSNT
ncbi:hypothetical protein HDV63DRAFT_377113, partial [Trichoderma sp. SZMC 28014]